ncbi:MAG: Holliday junction branch migration protein RuvA [Flavobacteriales bacterium]|nr:Holliday junction branch migration protein RuvA [Flavobacteriales bacterium]
MIHHLNGRLVEKSPTHAVIECGGVGYYVHISLNTFSKLGDDENVRLHTHMVVREDAQMLFGFMEPSERTIFLKLISVSGVGASTGRMILSSLSPAEIQAAIQGGDVNTIKSVKGIGAKTAQRIIVDLQDKIGDLAVEGEKITSVGNTIKIEALTALSSLGFDNSKTNKTLEAILSKTPTISVEDLIKEALKMM